MAEVYTNEREVNAMLDLIPLKKPDSIISYKYLEPACGNGNFLIEILRRKLIRINEKYADKHLNTYEFYLARGLSSIYGIDICPENVEEARERLFTEIKSSFDLHKGSYIYSNGFIALTRYILEHNIVVGDAINGAEKIFLTDYKYYSKQIERRLYQFSTLIENKSRPIKIMARKHFLQIGLEHERN